MSISDDRIISFVPIGKSKVISLPAEAFVIISLKVPAVLSSRAEVTIFCAKAKDENQIEMQKNSAAKVAIFLGFFNEVFLSLAHCVNTVA